jgi:hypothetical protein
LLHHVNLSVSRKTRSILIEEIRSCALLSQLPFLNSYRHRNVFWTLVYISSLHSVFSCYYFYIWNISIIPQTRKHFAVFKILHITNEIWNQNWMKWLNNFHLQLRFHRRPLLINYVHYSCSGMHYVPGFTEHALSVPSSYQRPRL